MDINRVLVPKLLVGTFYKGLYDNNGHKELIEFFSRIN